MSHDEARVGAAARPKRERRVAGVGQRAEQAAHLQDLGDALQGTVRALRQGDPLAEGFARRLQKAWLQLDERRIDWLPTELKAGSRVVLTASGETGRFVVPAYQAGLRALSLRDEATVEQLGSFCRGLAMLEAGSLHPSAFGRLLWRGELLAFDAVVVESEAELGEALVREIEPAALWAERSARVVDVWSRFAQRAEGVPDAELEARFGMPLVALRARVERGELELADEDVRGLMHECDDAAGGAAAEGSRVLNHPSARPTGTAEPRGAPLGLACAMIGGAFARRLLAAGDVPVEAWPVLDGLAREVRAALLSGLCRSGESTQTGAALLLGLCRRYGAAELFEALDAPQLGPVMAAAVARAALETSVAPATLLHVIERMDAESALSALAAAPALCPQAVGIVANVLLQESYAVRHLPALVRAGAEGAACAGAALVTALARGAELSDLDETLVQLIAAGQGRAVVLPIWQRRALRVATRRSALLALQADTRLFSDAMHFADSGDEPKELRELLEELRWQEPR